jgi:dTDP-4-amino-4,6-dideoxygalactose transaminase
VSEPDLLQELAAVLARMPDPSLNDAVRTLETGLADDLGVPYVVAVASGTAAVHTALLACGIGPGDEVLVPATCVVMSAAPVIHAGARPVFIDCDAEGVDLDWDDAARKLTRRTRAIMPVHLWGLPCCRAGNLCDFAAARGLQVIEDACQGQGSRMDGQPLGTLGDAGCFSLKDGKICSCGEGGYVVSGDPHKAARARAVRSHWLTPPDGQRPMAHIGYNYRLAEPLAIIAEVNRRRFGQLLARRRDQALLLAAQLKDVPGLIPVRPHPGDEPNGYSAVFRIDLPNPRRFCEHLATVGVPNSVGSFRLVAAHQRPVFAPADPCPNAAALIDRTLAIVLSERDSDERLSQIADIVTKEARAWRQQN